MKVTLLLACICIISVNLATFAAYAGALITVDGKAYKTAEEASAAIKNFSQVILSKGEHVGELKVAADDVFITGENGSIVKVTETASRGFFTISGQRVSIENINCIGSTNKNRGGCIWHNGSDLTIYNSQFSFSGAAVIDIANTGSLSIDSSTFSGGGNWRGRAVIDASSPNLTIFNSQFKGAAAGAHLIKAKSSNTKILNSFLLANDSTGRLIDLPFGGIVLIEGSLLVQSTSASSSQAISYGSSTMGRARSHNLNVKRNLILLEREKGSQFLVQNFSAKTPFEIAENVFIGEFKDSKRFFRENLVFEDRKIAKMSTVKLPDYKKVADFIKYYQLVRGQ